MRSLLAQLLVTSMLAFTVSSMADTKQRPVVVDLHAHRAEIRAALLHHTPIGSNSADVLKFVSTQLDRSGNAPVTLTDAPATGPAAQQSHHSGAKNIRIYLGQYPEHAEVVFLSAPMMMQREVSAQWAFDPQGRLIDIFVHKESRIY